MIRNKAHATFKNKTQEILKQNLDLAQKTISDEATTFTTKIHEITHTIYDLCTKTLTIEQQTGEYKAYIELTQMLSGLETDQLFEMLFQIKGKIQ